MLFLMLERLVPRRAPESGRWARAATILLLVGFDTLHLLVPLAAVGTAELGAANGWGLNYWLDWPFWMAVIASFLLLDLLIYGQHVLFHKVSWLWRLHRLHHTDTAFDVTTGVRFHPIEIGLSMLLKMAAVLVLGAPVVAVILFDGELNATSLLKHANINRPAGASRAEAAATEMIANQKH